MCCWIPECCLSFHFCKVFEVNVNRTCCVCMCILQFSISIAVYVIVRIHRVFRTLFFFVRFLFPSILILGILVLYLSSFIFFATHLPIVLNFSISPFPFRHMYCTHTHRETYTPTKTQFNQHTSPVHPLRNHRRKTYIYNTHTRIDSSYFRNVEEATTTKETTSKRVSKFKNGSIFHLF